ncbi:MAG: sulfatase [Planctomycetota bacterium]
MNTPNILICTWHDTGRHFGCYGQDTVHSPNVDRLAAEGVRFDRAYCSSAKCSPSRGSCMTGLYPQRNGLHYLCHGNFGYRLNDGSKHLAQLLRERGYYSILHGFQHEVEAEQIAGLGHHQAVNHLPAPPMHPVPPCEVIAADAARWLESEAAGKAPFFMQLGFFETHRRYSFGNCKPDDSKGVAVPYWAQDDAITRDDMAALQGSIRKADAQFGVVLDALERNGLADNTIVIFTVDHGLDMLGAKGTCFEPGIEIACVMRWPAGGIQGGLVSDRLISNVDVVPTLFALAGLEAPTPCDGVGFADVFNRNYRGDVREYVFTMIQEGERRSVRNERYKLIRNFDALKDYARPVRSDPYRGPSTGWEGIGGKQNTPDVLLFDLQEDPVETANLAEDPAYQAVRQELETALWQHLELVGDPLLNLPHEPRRREHLRQYLNWRAEHGHA